MNEVKIAGRLGCNPRSLTNPRNPERSYCEMSLGFDKTVVVDGEESVQRRWIKVRAYGPLGERCFAHLKQGSGVLFECELDVDPTSVKQAFLEVKSFKSDESVKIIAPFPKPGVTKIGAWLENSLPEEDEERAPRIRGEL